MQEKTVFRSKSGIWEGQGERGERDGKSKMEARFQKVSNVYTCRGCVLGEEIPWNSLQEQLEPWCDSGWREGGTRKMGCYFLPPRSHFGFFFFFWPHLAWILIPWSVMETVPPEMQVWGSNPWPQLAHQRILEFRLFWALNIRLCRLSPLRDIGV